MSITSAFCDLLRADAAVLAIVGYDNNGLVNVHDGWVLDAKRPYITVIAISDTPEHHMTAAAGVTSARLQVDCWTDTRWEAADLSTAVREALDGRPSGAMGDDSLVVHSVRLLDGPANNDEPPVDKSDTPIFRDRLDFNAWYDQSVPTFA